jgi:MoaA/NifB/PqqE/SkfB family radical SAM enzyme|tara:strand:- start:289 stop:909 length:621 start_codon:yes stop_codon:yes gene_type:complete
MARFSKINLDITHRCTLQCQRCNRAIFAARGQSVPGEDMTMENFKKVINFFEEVYFCGQISDPIFHPQFIEFLKLLRGRKTIVHTAASHKKEEWYRKAFEANTGAYWTFGIDGLPKDSHKYRKNQDGEHLFKMACMAAKMGLLVKWQYLIFSYNENDIEEAKQMAKDNNLILELQKSSRFWKDDPLMPKNKDYYIERKSYENPTKV